MSSKFYGNFSFYDIALRPKKDKVSLITNQQEIQEDIGCIPEKSLKINIPAIAGGFYAYKNPRAYAGDF